MRIITEYFPKEFVFEGEFSKQEFHVFGKRWELLFFGENLFRILCPEEEKELSLDRFLEKRGVIYGQIPQRGGPFCKEKVQICLIGTQLQRSVWKELLKLSWGEKISYSELAKRAGNPRAIRAVASAVGDNPLPLLVPCHRVIFSSGEVGQFRYGTELKLNLLVFEEVFEGSLDERFIIF